MRWVGVLLLLAVGCDKPALRVGLPEIRDDAQAVVVAIETGTNGSFSSVEDVRVFDPNSGSTPDLPLLPSYDDGRDARITMISYEKSLEVLGLQPGLLEGGGELSVELDATQVDVSFVRSASIEDWQTASLARVPEPLANFRYLDARPCRCLVGEHLEVRTTTASPEALLRLGEKRVLGVLDDASLVLIHEGVEGRIETVDDRGFLSLPYFRGRRVSGAAVHPDGGIYIGGRTAQLWRIELDGNRVAAPMQLVTSATIARPDVAPPAGCHQVSRGLRWMTIDPPWLFGLETDGVLEAYNLETGEWRVIHRFPPRCDGEFMHGGLSLIGPGRIAAVYVRSEDVVTYDVESDVVEVERTAVGEGLGAVVGTQGLGLIVAGAASGSIGFSQNGAQLACDSQVGNGVGVLLPFEDGFIVGSTQGFIEQYSPSVQGWCDKLQSATGGLRFGTTYSESEESPAFAVTGPKAEERNQQYAVISILRPAPTRECATIVNPGSEPLPECTLGSP